MKTTKAGSSTKGPSRRVRKATGSTNTALKQSSAGSLSSAKDLTLKEPSPQQLSLRGSTIEKTHWTLLRKVRDVLRRDGLLSRITKIKPYTNKGCSIIIDAKTEGASKILVVLAMHNAGFVTKTFQEQNEIEIFVSPTTPVHKGDFYFTETGKVDLSKITVRWPGRGLFIKDVGGKKIIQDVFWCMDCLRRNPAIFAVHNHVWEEAKLGRGILCVECLELRLKRPLRLVDFKREALCNDHIFWAWHAALKT